MVRALRYRNYRLFFGGQIVSLCGTWMTNIATSWLVYRLTGSPLMLGVVTCAGQIPIFLICLLYTSGNPNALVIEIHHS